MSTYPSGSYPDATIHNPAEGLRLHGHLGLILRREPGDRVLGWLPARDDLAPDGRTAFGTIGFLCDVVGGQVAGLAARPRWVVTTDLDVRAVGDGAVVGPVRAEGRVVRAGRTSIVAALEVRATADDRLVAVATVGATPLDADFDPFLDTVAEGVAVDSGPAPTDPEPFGRFLGLDPVGGRMVFDMPPLARNPWGIMHGGVVVEAVVATGLSAAGDLLGAPVVATAVHNRFLNGAKVGPYEVTADILGPATDAATGPIRVEMVDRGVDRTVALAVVEARVDDGVEVAGDLTVTGG